MEGGPVGREERGGVAKGGNQAIVGHDKAQKFLGCLMVGEAPHQTECHIPARHQEGVEWIMVSVEMED